MKKLFIFIIGTCIAIGFLIGVSVNASAQELTIPKWIKNTALWWGQGQISDSEFIKALQYLIEQGILVVNQPSTSQSAPQIQSFSGISNTTCHRDEITPNIVHMLGKFTNGPTPYSMVSLQLGLIDASGRVVATGLDSLYDVGARQTKIFDAEAIYSGQYAKCEIEIYGTVP